MQADDTDRPPAAHRRSRPLLFALIALVVFGGFGLLLRQLLVVPPPASSVALQTSAAQSTAPIASGSVTKPIPVPATTPEQLPAIVEPPLRELDHSDPEVSSSLGDILPPALRPALQSSDLLRRAVALLEGFSRGKLLRDKLPLPLVSGKLAVTRQGERIVLSPDNFARYDTLCDTVAEIDPGALGRWFDRYEPLLRAAWVELGNGEADVRGLLLAGIDRMLDAPEPPAEIVLTQPSVFYKFADPALEAMPDSAKLMLRVGPRNRTLLTDRLRLLRRELER